MVLVLYRNSGLSRLSRGQIDSMYCKSLLLVNARGVLDTPDPGSTNFDKKLCTLILVEIGLSPYLECDKKHTEKTEKYYPLVTALKKHWGRVEFVVIPIGYAGTTLTRTLDHLTAAFSMIHTRADQTNANKGTRQPITDSNARSHDYRMFKSLMNELVD